MDNTAKRLNLRLSRICNCNCDHCTMRDVPPVEDLSFTAAVRIAEEKYAENCREIVLMREASLWPALSDFVFRLRDIGYKLIQMQTNGRVFAERVFTDKMQSAGLTHAEINIFAARKETADAIMQVPGAQLQVLAGIRNLAEAGVGVLAVIPTLKSNLSELGLLVRLLASMGVWNVQFNFPRPVYAAGRWFLDSLPSLSAASKAVRPAMALADSLGMSVGTEAFPFCHLDPHFRQGAESSEDFSRHVIVDLHIAHEDAGVQRRQGRPYAAACEQCAAKQNCPVTWLAYQELFGVEELRPLKSLGEELKP